MFADAPREPGQISKHARAVLNDPTVENYKGKGTTGFHQSVRRINASLEQLSSDPKIKKFKDQVWIGLSQDRFIPTKDEDVTPKVQHVVKCVGKLDKVLQQL